MRLECRKDMKCVFNVRKGSRTVLLEGDTWGPGMLFVVMRVVTMSRCCVVVMMRQNPAVACS